MTMTIINHESQYSATIGQWQDYNYRNIRKRAKRSLHNVYCVSSAYKTSRRTIRVKLDYFCTGTGYRRRFRAVESRSSRLITVCVISSYSSLAYCNNNDVQHVERYNTVRIRFLDIVQRRRQLRRPSFDHITLVTHIHI